jgi:hypothetical protein
MKIKLLKRLRDTGRASIIIYSVTRTNDIVTGMQYGCDDEGYSNIFSIGDTEEDMKDKACKVWLSKNIEWVRKKYKKYSLKVK